MSPKKEILINKTKNKKTILPEDYKSKLDLKETEKAEAGINLL